LTRLRLLVLPALALAAPASPQQGRSPDTPAAPGRAYANPSAGIAADLALARLTGGRKGRWHALRETAADDAVILAPRVILAQPWLKQRKDPAPPFRLQPMQAWASCDGSLVITSGLQREAGVESRYTRVWRRQDDGGYKWVFSHILPGGESLSTPDVIEGKGAACPPRRTVRTTAAGTPPPQRQRGRAKQDAAPIVVDPAGRQGASGDGSLAWQVTVDADGGAHRFTASMRTEGAMRLIRDERAAAAGS